MSDTLVLPEECGVQVVEELETQFALLWMESEMLISACLEFQVPHPPTLLFGAGKDPDPSCSSWKSTDPSQAIRQRSGGLPPGRGVQPLGNLCSNEPAQDSGFTRSPGVAALWEGLMM